MARLAGLRGYGDLAREFRLRNLLPEFRGKNGKGDLFPMLEAREAALRMPLRGTVLLAGKSVGRAFGASPDYFEWSSAGAARIAVIPHPSGISHWWNSPENVERASAFMRGVLG